MDTSDTRDKEESNNESIPTKIRLMLCAVGAGSEVHVNPALMRFDKP
jgi:hypothetical protein